MIGGTLRKILFGLVVLLAVSAVFGTAFGQPAGLSYVETGSMEPVMEPGDGFIAVPTFVTGPAEEGDVVVFKPIELNDGNLVTHRIVDETDAGYITKGDANPVTDQDGAEPPVQPSQIKAKALEVGGSVLVIPNLGVAVIALGDAVTWVQQQLAAALGTRAVLGTQGVAYLLLGFGLITYIAATLVESSGKRDRSRGTSRRTGVMSPVSVIAAMTVVLIVILTASMVLPAGPQQFQFVSAETDSAGAGVIKQGTAETLTYQVPSNGPLPVVTVFEAGGDGVSVSPSSMFVPGGGTKNATVTLQAPPETGSYARSIHEHRYLAFLPAGTILALYEIHPWTPIVAIDALLGTLFAVVALLLVGLDPIRLSRRGRDLPLTVRIRRLFR